MYDYLIVGSGLFGSTFAHQVYKKGKSCLIIDRRDHAGGNVYCKNVDGINLHVYGPHIFHTNDEKIWNFVNSFTHFRPYVYSPMANYRGKLYNLPFNMNTFYQLWGCTSPEEAARIIESQRTFKAYKGSQYGNYTPAMNLEDKAISLVGTDVYKSLIKGYSEKQWGRDCKDIPAFIITRLPVRFTYDNNYFDDTYQGMPVSGYNDLTLGLQAGMEVRTGTNYLADPVYFNGLAKRIVYTGAIDEFFNYQFGALEYRSIQFKHVALEQENYQGCAVMNFTGTEVPYTRIIEHKHFYLPTASSSKTVVSFETPCKWSKGDEPFYPINDVVNNKRYIQYRDLAAATCPHVIFGGRLGSYKYYNMDQVIAAAIKTASLEV